MKIFYFTATGNSLYVAKQFGGELYSIPQVLKNDELTFEDEKIGIVFPCYAFSAPNIVREFIEKVTLKSPYIFAVLTYGNISGNSAEWFTQYAKKHGTTIHYSNSLLMVDNYLPMFDMEQQKQSEKNIEENLRRIVKDVAENEKYISSSSLFFKVMTKGMGSMSKFIFNANSAKKFSVDDKCNGCGTCVKVCPRNNVTINNGRPIYGAKCEFCLACIQLCPKKSIRLKNEKNPNSRFRNENISLKEIVDANN